MRKKLLIGFNSAAGFERHWMPIEVTISENLESEPFAISMSLEEYMTFALHWNTTYQTDVN